jgi:hypothetical protein
MTRITVNDAYQKHYTYTLSAPFGQDFAEDFLPQITPKEMLAMGVFGGVYFSDCPSEFPADWYENMKSSTGEKDAKLNFFGVDASMPLQHRQEK